MGNVRVYPVDDGFVVSHHGTWLPGYYDTAETATKAASLPDRVLTELNDRICHFQREDRALTMSDLAPFLTGRLGMEG